MRFPVVEVGRSKNGFVRIAEFRTFCSGRSFGQKIGCPVIGLPGRVGVVVAVAVRRQLVDVDHDGIRCFRTFWRTCSNDPLVDQPLAGELVVPDVVFELDPLVPGGRFSDIRTFCRTSSVGRAFSGTRQAR